MDNLNLEIENIASKLDGDYIEAIVSFRRNHPMMDFYDIKDLLDPIVLEKVKLTAYKHNYFPNIKLSKSLDDIFSN